MIDIKKMVKENPHELVVRLKASDMEYWEALKESVIVNFLVKDSIYASKIKDKNIDIYVSVLNGEVKDNYMSIAFSEKESIQKVIDAYFGESGHAIKDLGDLGIYVTTTPFIGGKTVNIS
jgi:hypothetical protein